MNKQEWLKIKKEKKYTIELLYEFWVDNKKPTYKDLTLEEFTQIISIFINAYNGMISQMKINDHFDKKFNITKVFNNKGEIVKEF